MSKNATISAFKKLNPDDVIAILVEELKKKTGKSDDEIVEMVVAKLPTDTFTRDELEKRNYTYVSAYMNDYSYERFLVTSPYTEEAEKRAILYLKNKGVYEDVTEIKLYPRNYIRKARVLFDEGRYL